MTENDKDILIERMLDNPDCLTADDIAAIMADEELRGLYDTSVMLADSLLRQPAIDTDREWALFSGRIADDASQLDAAGDAPQAVPPQLKRKHLSLSRVMRIAAVIAGLLLLSGVIVRMASSSQQGERVLVADNVNTVEAPYTGTDTANEADSLREVRITDTLPGEHIADAATPEAVKPAAASPKRKAMHEDDASYATLSASTELAIDEYITLEQARIDNEIAMARARVYEAEYSAYLDMAGKEPDPDVVIHDAPALDRSVGTDIDRVVML